MQKSKIGIVFAPWERSSFNNRQQWTDLTNKMFCKNCDYLCDSLNKSVFIPNIIEEVIARNKIITRNT